MFSAITGLKIEISFLLGLPFWSGITDAVLAFSAKTFCMILVLIAFVSNGVKKNSLNTSWVEKVLYQYHSPFLYLQSWRKYLAKVKKPSKIGQDFKNLLSNFAFFDSYHQSLISGKKNEH